MKKTLTLLTLSVIALSITAFTAKNYKLHKNKKAGFTMMYPSSWRYFKKDGKTDYFYGPVEDDELVSLFSTNIGKFKGTVDIEASLERRIDYMKDEHDIKVTDSKTFNIGDKSGYTIYYKTETEDDTELDVISSIVFTGKKIVSISMTILSEYDDKDELYEDYDKVMESIEFYK